MRRIVTDNAHVGPWIAQHGGGFYRDGSQCIGLERDGELIAGFLYDFFNGSSICMHVASKNAYWPDREFLRVSFEYPFIQLGVRVVIGLIAEKNPKGRRFAEHVGCKLTATIPEGHPDGSLLIYTLRAEDCRWVRRQHETRRTARA